MHPLFYLKCFLKDMSVASVYPTSSYTVGQVCSRANLDSIDLIVEYGPGGGVFTKYILDNIKPDAKLVALETNDVFYKYLKNNINDPRFHLFKASAQDVLLVLKELGLNQADCVISGIPFSFFSDEVGGQLIDVTKAALKPEGKFIVYQCLFQPFRAGKRIEAHLNNGLRLSSVSSELINLPPLRIYEAVKHVN
jgi:phospholipid N-methyltransferase